MLARDAEARGLSLQQYLLEVLENQGRAARNAEFLRRWEPVRGSGPAAGEPVSAVEMIAQSREERDAHLLRLTETDA